MVNIWMGPYFQSPDIYALGGFRIVGPHIRTEIPPWLQPPPTHTHRVLIPRNQQITLYMFASLFILIESPREMFPRNHAKQMSGHQIV